MTIRRTASTVANAPHVGRVARLAGPLRVNGVFWYRLHAFGARAVPDLLSAIVHPMITAAFTLVLIRISSAIASNLRPVLGPAGWFERKRRAYRTITDFAWCVTERYEWLDAERPPRGEVELERHDVWKGLAQSPEGMIVLTAHIGNWEFGSAMPSSEDGRRVHLVRETEADPKAQEFMRTMLEGKGGDLYTTHFATDDPSLGLDLLEALRNGDIVALQGDRPRRGGAVADTRLFGRPFAIPIGPFALARLAEVPVVPVFMFREDPGRSRRGTERGDLGHRGSVRRGSGVGDPTKTPPVVLLRRAVAGTGVRRPLSRPSVAGLDVGAERTGRDRFAVRAGLEPVHRERRRAALEVDRRAQRGVARKVRAKTTEVSHPDDVAVRARVRAFALRSVGDLEHRRRLRGEFQGDVRGHPPAIDPRAPRGDRADGLDAVVLDRSDILDQPRRAGVWQAFDRCARALDGAHVRPPRAGARAIRGRWNDRRDGP